MARNVTMRLPPPCDYDQLAYQRPTRYKVDEVPHMFMNRKIVECEKLIDDLLLAKSSQEEIDDCYNRFVEVLHDEMGLYFKKLEDTPQAKKNLLKHVSKPWWSSSLSVLNRRVHQLEKKWRDLKKHGRECRYAHNSFRIAQHDFDREARRLKRKWNREQVLQMEKLNCEDPVGFWEAVKRLGRKPKKPIPQEVYMNDGSVSSELSDVMEIWERDFKSLLNPGLLDDDIEYKLHKEHICKLNQMSEQCNMYGPYMEFDKEFTVTEVRSIVMKAKSGKAPGLDGIVSEVVKNDICIKVLTTLFNKCLTTGLLPSQWLKAIICPIPKSATNDPRLPLSYHGISLLPVISKLYTSLLGHRVGGFLEKNHILVDEQNGFRPDRSCVDHIFTICDLLRIRKAQNLETFCSFIDFQKAFDLVDRDFLLYKLSEIGVTGNVYRAIKAMYTGPVSCVNVNGRLTGWFGVGSGVRQGDSLSPTLFSIFINDLAREIKDMNLGIHFDGDNHLALLLYADDIVIIAPSHANSQAMLDTLTRWCRKWGMRANIAKSQVVHVRNQQRPQCEKDLFLDLQEMIYVSDYKYLGCWINEFLNNTRTVEALTSAAGRSFGRIINMFRKMGDMGYETYSTLCDSYVLPVANYAAGVWGFKDYPAPQVLQNKIQRFFLGVHTYAPLPALHTEMDWLEMRSLRWLEMIRLFNRIVCMDSTRLPRRILEWDYRCRAKGWLSDLLSVCAEANVPIPDEIRFIYDIDPVRRKLIVKNRQEWRNAAENMSKLCTYIKIRDFSEIGQLVQSNLKRNHRCLVSRLLCGILPLGVETGRYTNIKKELRFCKICKTQEIDDEIHFIFICSKFKDAREKFIEPLYKGVPECSNMNNFEKLEWMLHRSRIREFGAAFAGLYKCRQDFLYK